MLCHFHRFEVNNFPQISIRRQRLVISRRDTKKVFPYSSGRRMHPYSMVTNAYAELLMRWEYFHITFSTTRWGRSIQSPLRSPYPMIFQYHTTNPSFIPHAVRRHRRLGSQRQDRTEIDLLPLLRKRHEKFRSSLLYLVMFYHHLTDRKVCPHPNTTRRLTHPIDFKMSRYLLSCFAPTCVVEERVLGVIRYMVFRSPFGSRI